MERCYRSSTAAGELGITKHHLLKLVKAGHVDAELVNGQYRIPLAEVERLKKSGVPPIPQELVPAAVAVSTARRDREDESPDVRGERDVLTKTQLFVERRKTELELAHVEDEFKARQAREEAPARRQAVQAAQAEAEKQRQMQIISVVTAVRVALPGDCPEEFRTQVADECYAQLTGSTMPLEVMVLQARSIMDEKLNAWRAQQQRRSSVTAALEAAVRQLPPDARSYLTPTLYQVQAKQRAYEAVAPFADYLNEHELATLARESTRPVLDQFERDRHKQKILADGLWHVQGATSGEREAMRNAVQQALNRAPVDANTSDLDELRDKALRPFEISISKRLRAQDLIEQGVALLQESFDEYDWDSRVEEWIEQNQIRAELSGVLRAAIERGTVSELNLRKFVRTWAEERLDED